MELSAVRACASQAVCTQLGAVAEFSGFGAPGFRVCRDLDA